MKLRRTVTILSCLVVLGVLAPAPARAELYTPYEVVDATAPVLDAYWSDVFVSSGYTYTSPDTIWWYNTVEFPGPTWNACGQVPLDNAAYCALDGSLYLDDAFLWWGIQTYGDFAIAAVVAHEWAHHIENQLGLLGAGYLTIQVELLADCWAGTASAHMKGLGMLEPGDLEEAYTLTLSMGDEHLGNVSPTDPGAHGTSGQRLTAFLSGYQRGDPAGCYTTVDQILGLV